jgi:tagatose-1,6-bisphosphate aldolase
MSTPITQDTLNQMNDIIHSLITQYANGLLMDIEFANAVYAVTKFVEGADLSNLLDPNTGLRYPTTSPTN